MIIKLDKDFHGFVDEVENNETQYIESEGEMINNPKYNSKNELKDVEAKLKQYEEEYYKSQHEGLPTE